MSIRRKMILAMRRAPGLLHKSADRVVDFLLSQMDPSGSFKNRSGAADLYYTVFGIESLIALESEFPREKTIQYLETFGPGDSLDFVHLTCLARLWADLSSEGPPPPIRRWILKQLETFRTPDEGYNQAADAKTGTVYAAFLALGAIQDLNENLVNANGLAYSVKSLKDPDGSFRNNRQSFLGSTPATAAAVILLSHTGDTGYLDSCKWLLFRCLPGGGFLAMPESPLPDLLSTATALHALNYSGYSLDHIREQCIDFADSLWDSKGGFYGHCADTVLDCEYTFYGLLVLGNLVADTKASCFEEQDRL